MKIGKYNFVFKYKGQSYEDMEELIANMSYEELKEHEESLKKVLNVMIERRKMKAKEMRMSKVLIVAGGISLILSPFILNPVLKYTIMGLSLASISGAIVSYKKEKRQRQILTLKMLTSKFQQKEIVREMQNRLNGKKYFNAPACENEKN